MAWKRWIGFDDRYLTIAGTPEERKRQEFIFSMLAIIISSLSAISAISTAIYMLIIFHNWFIAVLTGLFIGLVVFNLNGLIVITAFSAYGTTLAEYFNDHTRYYQQHLSIEKEISDVTDEWIDEKVFLARRQLEQMPEFEVIRRPLDFGEMITMSLRVFFLCVFAIIFSTGMEIFIFRDHINEVLKGLNAYYQKTGDVWMVENILTARQGDSFIMINSYSLLLVLEILLTGLGLWKIVLDILFMFLFITPLIIVFRSREFKEGGYIRAHIISCLSISFRHHLISRRFCQRMDKLFNDTRQALKMEIGMEKEAS